MGSYCIFCLYFLYSLPSTCKSTLKTSSSLTSVHYLMHGSVGKRSTRPWHLLFYVYYPCWSNCAIFNDSNWVASKICFENHFGFRCLWLDIYPRYLSCVRNVLCSNLPNILKRQLETLGMFRYPAISWNQLIRSLSSGSELKMKNC